MPEDIVDLVLETSGAQIIILFLFVTNEEAKEAVINL